MKNNIQMKNLTLNTMMVLFLVFISENSFSQKKILIQEYDKVIASAKSELDNMLKNGGALQLEAAKLNLKGEFVIDMTIHDKGKVQSVFMVSSDAGDVKMQNAVKDLVRRIEFNFKVPKDKAYKFQYTFNF